MIYNIDIYPPLKDKVNKPIATLKSQVVNTGGQGRLTLIKNKQERHVSTCNQYQSAAKEGFLPATTFDRSISSFFILWCGSLNWLEHAKKAQSSFVANFNLKRDFGQLPTSVFFTPLGEKSTGTTLLQQYPDMTVISSKPHAIILASKKAGRKTVINWLAKADFNDNGIQDLLFSVAEYAIDGSYRQYGVYGITKSSENSPFQRIRYD